MDWLVKSAKPFPERKEQVDEHSPPQQVVENPWPWRDAFANAVVRLNTTYDDFGLEEKKVLEDLGCTESSRGISQDYIVWARALEVQGYADSGGDVNDESLSRSVVEPRPRNSRTSQLAGITV